MTNLNFWDVAGIAACWAGAVLIAYITRDNSESAGIAILCGLAGIST